MDFLSVTIRDHLLHLQRTRVVAKNIERLHVNPRMRCYAQKSRLLFIVANFKQSGLYFVAYIK